MKWGVISTAKIGTEKVIPAMQESDKLEILAIAGRDLEKTRETAQSLRIPRAYGSYEELLADPSIEAIYNPLPNHLHVEWTIKALEAGKHVLCEKPIGLDTEDAKRLIAARDKSGKHVLEAFMVRHHPQWQEARRLVESGQIGTITTVQSIFTYFNADPNNVRNKKDIGGGGLLDIGCYCIVGPRYITGKEPVRVVSLMDKDPKFGTDRLVSGMLDFGSGGGLPAIPMAIATPPSPSAMQWCTLLMSANRSPSRPSTNQSSHSGRPRSNSWDRTRPARRLSWRSSPGGGRAVWRTW